jgi:GTP-binding protein EngB required for normal cell division
MSLSRRTAPHSDDMYTIAVYKRDADHIFYDHRNKKTYNTEVVWNSVVKLLVKGNFKQRVVCGKFDKIRSNRFQTKLKLTLNETQNGWSERIHLVEVHLFHVGHMFQ